MTIMDERIPSRAISSSQIALLVRALESLTDGELAVDMLIAAGEGSILPLEEFLLRGKARTIAVPRCRAARALGGLRARETLLSYFAKVDLPADPVVLFAEDAVRSTVAHELLHWRDDEVFYALLKAATQRATVGLIESLGEFCRSEAIPVLFETLEDDLCRYAAFAALCKTPEESRHYAILSLRGGAGASLTGAAASRRRRATAELFRELGISHGDWLDVARLLEDEDPTVIISAATVGFRVAPEEEYPGIISALFRLTHKLNWLQEDEVVHLLDEHVALAHCEANRVLADLRARGERVNWLSATWRILGHLGRLDLEQREHDVA
jgi:HEAT repeat protein